MAQCWHEEPHKNATFNLLDEKQSRRRPWARLIKKSNFLLRNTTAYVVSVKIAMSCRSHHCDFSNLFPGIPDSLKSQTSYWNWSQATVIQHSCSLPNKMSAVAFHVVIQVSLNGYACISKIQSTDKRFPCQYFKTLHRQTAQ